MNNKHILTSAIIVALLLTGCQQSITLEPLISMVENNKTASINYIGNNNHTAIIEVSKPIFKRKKYRIKIEQLRKLNGWDINKEFEYKSINTFPLSILPNLRKSKK